MESFNGMGIPEELLRALEKNDLLVPTPIQQQAISLAWGEGRDVLGTAQTGAGKTLAFVIPLLSKLLTNPRSVGLILAPTRELAQQVLRVVENLSPVVLNTAMLIGQDPMFKQLRQLRNRPRVIVGTSGRILDHIERGSFKAEFVDFLVLDEADRMFDMGFGDQLKKILSRIPVKRQTLMFSATLPNHIQALAQSYLSNPARVMVDAANHVPVRLEQETVYVTESDKYQQLLNQLEKRTGSILVFVKTKIRAAELAESLGSENHQALAMHGDLRQRDRERVLQAFRRGNARILVATDVAARGLDISHIQHVINFDLPFSVEDYVHRIGRTARAGMSGSALCLVTPKEKRRWFLMQSTLNGTPANEKLPEERRKPFSKPAAPRRPMFSKTAKPAHGSKFQAQRESRSH